MNVTCNTLSVRCDYAAKDDHAPQIFMGASSSSKMGWLMKISRAFVQRYLISYSWSCTGFPGRLPRTRGGEYRGGTDQRIGRSPSRGRSMTESRSISVAVSAMSKMMCVGRRGREEQSRAGRVGS